MRPFGFLARLRLDKTSNLFALLAAETLLLWIVELKSSLTFVDYGFGDGGLNLTVQYLLGSRRARNSVRTLGALAKKSGSIPSSRARAARHGVSYSWPAEVFSTCTHASRLGRDF
jgi:hypothetical protein